MQNAEGLLSFGASLLWWTVLESNQIPAVMSSPLALQANGPYAPLRRVAGLRLCLCAARRMDLHHRSVALAAELRRVIVPNRNCTGAVGAVSLLRGGRYINKEVPYEKRTLELP